jgi:transcriptional antiterminator NusG
MSQNEQRRWFVVYSKAHKEAVAEFQLRLKGVEVFFPQLFLPRSLRRWKRLIPLFPNYLFVRISIPEEYERVTWTPGVKRIVNFNDVPVPLEEDIVGYLMRQASPTGVITARSNLKVGQEISISEGPFDGLAGTIQQPPNARGRVKVLMELLNRRMTVDVPVQFLKSGEVAYQPTGWAERFSQTQD